MSNENEREELRALAAEAAQLTPHPFEEGHGWVFTLPVYDDTNALANVMGDKYADPDRQEVEAARVQANARYIAAASPDRITALLDDLDAADRDADQLRTVLFRIAEDLTRIKRVCTQDHPPKMGSPTRDWPAGTECRHSDGTRCVLLNDGDYALIDTPADTPTEPDVDERTTQHAHDLRDAIEVERRAFEADARARDARWVE